MPIQLNGIWSGIITYGKEYRRYAGSELHFEFEITQDGSNFTGTGRDTRGFGFTIDPATIRGYVNGNDVRFIKQYSTYNYFTWKWKSRTVPSRPGPLIDYAGTFNPLDGTISGNWIIRGKVRLFWLIPLRFKCTGTWTMRRK
jgi:hypothetical protein